MHDLDSKPSDIRLTQTVKKGGCAAKLPAKDLRQVLTGFGTNPPPQLIVGMGDMDDAALWDLGDGTCQIHTTDFFTPIVDDAEDFGAIAAANALSDIYAMGGEPQTALCILGFPQEQLPLALLKPLMNGAHRIVEQAEACIAGGHSIENPALIFGLAVTGRVDKEHAWTNQGSKPGDVLILTKGLGTGTITSALKSGEAEPEWIRSAVDSMTTLNKAADLMRDIPVNAATDITGFSLAGHSMQMARASAVTFHIGLDLLPKLDGAMECLSKGVLNKAHRTNQLYVESDVTYDQTGHPEYWLTLDPQTSGGLLFSIPKPFETQALAQLQSRFPLATTIGKVLPPETHAVHFAG